MKHSCCSCRFLTSIIDNSKRTVFFCAFDQSNYYLQEVGLCTDDCELDDIAEDLWQSENENLDGDH